MSNYIMDLKFDSKTLRIFSLRITCKIQVLDKNERAPLRQGGARFYIL